MQRQFIYQIKTKVGSNLNRYTYVLNNPLKYTDPSGYAYQGFGNSQLNGVSTTLLNSSSQISQQVQDMETRRKGFVNSLWQNVTLFDLIGFYGGGDGGNDEPIPKKKQVNEIDNNKKSFTTNISKNLNNKSKNVANKPIITGIYDNSWDNLGYHISNIESKLDGRSNGTGLPPSFLRVAFSFFPPTSMVNAANVIVSGEDIYNRDANTFLERGILAPFNLFAPFASPKIENSIPFMMIDRFDKGKTVYDELWKK